MTWYSVKMTGQYAPSKTPLPDRKWATSLDIHRRDEMHDARRGSHNDIPRVALPGVLSHLPGNQNGAPPPPPPAPMAGPRTLDDKKDGSLDKKAHKDYSDSASSSTKQETAAEDKPLPTKTATPVQSIVIDTKAAAAAQSVTAAQCQADAGQKVHPQACCKETSVDTPQPTSPGPRRSPRLSRKRSSNEAEVESEKVEDDEQESAVKRAKK